MLRKVPKGISLLGCGTVPLQGDDWMHEAKFHGYRSQIIIDAGLGATQP